MNFKNIANHLLGILRKKGGGRTSSPRALLSYLLLLFIIFLKKPIKNQIYSKNVPVVFLETKQNKKTINRLPLSTKTICFS